MGATESVITEPSGCGKAPDESYSCPNCLTHAPPDRNRVWKEDGTTIGCFETVGNQETIVGCLPNGGGVCATVYSNDCPVNEGTIPLGPDAGFTCITYPTAKAAGKKWNVKTVDGDQF